MSSSEMLCHVALVRTNISEERQFLQEPHSITSQKMAFFIVTAVKTSNLIQYILLMQYCAVSIYIYIYMQRVNATVYMLISCYI
jgi:hypothetical protein